jgi:Spy/CpxP family protein refolding chaperone
MMSLLERSRLLGFGLLVITFLAGGLSGAAVERVLSADEPEAVEPRRDRGDDRRRYIIDRVEMAPEQRAAIQAIMEERSERMRAVWREVEPRLDAITDSTKAEIMSVLTPEQQAEYERRIAERRDKRRDREAAEDGATEPGDSTAAPAEEPAG